MAGSVRRRVGEEGAKRPAVVHRQVRVAGELRNVRARLELEHLARVHDPARAVPLGDRRHLGVLAVLRHVDREAVDEAVLAVLAVGLVGLAVEAEEVVVTKDAPATRRPGSGPLPGGA